MLLILVLSQKQQEKIDGKHESQLGGMAKSTYNQKAVLGPFSFIAIILSYCLDNVQLDSL